MVLEYLFSCQSCVPSPLESKQFHSAGLIHLVYMYLILALEIDLSLVGIITVCLLAVNLILPQIPDP